MAESGIVESGSSGASRPPGSSDSPKGGSDFFKKNKKVIIGGGALGALLLMGHHGSKASSGTTGTDLAGAQDQLQQQSDMIAAEQAALQSGSVTGSPGYGGADSSGGGTGNSDSTSGMDSTQGDSTLTTDPESTPTASGGQGPNQITVNVPNVPPAEEPSPHMGKKGGSGKHNKAANPARGGSHGHGTTVHGRTFPGGKHAVVHPPRKQRNGDVHQRVTVSHGGHTTSHTSVNGGERWIDHPHGSSVPSRTANSHRKHPTMVGGRK